jgi:hypothetical protein
LVGTPIANLLKSGEVNPNEKNYYCVGIALGAQHDGRLCLPRSPRLGERALGIARLAPVRVLSSISQIAEIR